MMKQLGVFIWFWKKKKSDKFTVYQTQHSQPN